MRDLVEALTLAGAQFVVIGGLALVARGSSRVTFDVDICYARNPENYRTIVAALKPFSPRLRGAPAELPSIFDERTLQTGLNFTFTTTAGDIDILGEVSGIGDYEAARELSSPVEMFGQSLDVLSLDGLEKSKRAAGRKKDLLDLEEIAEIRRQLALLADPSVKG